MYLGGTFADEVYAPYICKRQYPCYTIAMNISRKLPIGIQSFKDLRKKNFLYVDKTAEHSGVLIFVSVLERKVFVIADSGIAEKVAQNGWDGICKIMTDGLKKRSAAQAFADSVKECGRILQHHFPNKAENPNELPDGLIFLEL